MNKIKINKILRYNKINIWTILAEKCNKFRIYRYNLINYK
jgi:hypothetical protein